MSGGFRDEPDIEELEEDIADFLSRTGSVGLLHEVSPLKDKGSRFSELDDKVDVSSSTLTKRLDEGCELRILEVQMESTAYGSNKGYVLTGIGRRLRDRMERMRIFRTYSKMKTLEEELDEAVEDLREQVTGELFRRE